MWLGREPPVYSTESLVTLSSRRLCVAEPHCPSAAIRTAAGRAFLSPMEIAKDPTCFSFDCWLFPDWQLRLKGSEAGAEGASFWVNIPSAQAPLNQQGVALLIINAAVLSLCTRERGRERCHNKQAKKFKDTLQLCVSAPKLIFNASASQLQARSCIVKAFVSGWRVRAGKGLRTPPLPHQGGPIQHPSRSLRGLFGYRQLYGRHGPLGDWCFEAGSVGSAMRDGSERLSRGSGGWSRLSASKRTRPSDLVRLNPRTSISPPVLIGCDDILTGVFYTAAGGWGWVLSNEPRIRCAGHATRIHNDLGGGLFRLKMTKSRPGLDFFQGSTEDFSGNSIQCNL